MRRVFSFFALAFVLASIASCSGAKNFSAADKEIIHSNPDKLLHIYTVDNPSELEVLRARSEDLTEKAIHSDDYRILAERMIRTMADSTVGGVGLAAPQVGINKAVIAVQRFDKPGAPIEVYPNIRIVSTSEEIDVSMEGCLSIPGKRDYVDRFIGVEIEFYSIGQRKMIRDTVRQYPAFIFQHEIDHLDGKLYTDRLW